MADPIAHVPGSSRPVGNSRALDVAIVDSSGNQISSFGGSGGTAQADKSGFVEGSGNATPIAGVFNDSLGADPSEDSAVVPRITVKRALHVNLRDANGAEVSPGAGVQYTEGDTDTTITGTAMLFESNTGTSALGVVSNTTPLPVSDAGGLISIDDGAGSITVDGSVSISSGTVTAGNRAATATTTATWDSSTAADTVQQLNLSTTSAAVAFIRVKTTSGSFSAGTLNFEATDDAGTTWVPVTAVRADTLAAESTYALLTNTTQTWFLGLPGLSAGQVRVRLNPAITGTGSVDIKTNASAYGVPRVSAVVTNASGPSAVNIQDGGNSITVDGSVTANAGTNLNTSALALESGGNLATLATVVRAEDSASADADKGLVAFAVRKGTPANTSGTDGDYEALQISAGRLWASATIDAALPAGTNAIGKLASNDGVDIGNVDVASVVMPTGASAAQVQGTVAHDGASGQNPVRVGAKAETAISGVTLVADGDVTDLYAGVDGVLIVRKHCNLEDAVQDRATDTGGSSTAFAGGLAAPGSGIRLWVTQITVCNSHATTNGTVDIRDGSAGSVLWTMPAPATGGSIAYFDPPLKFTANTAVAYDVSAAITTITISANGFKSKV